MIRNLIFDLGNVLLSWKPDDFFENNGYTPEYKAIILRDIFRSPEWRMLDNGDITINEAIERISATSSLSSEEIASVFNLRTRILFPLESNVKMLPELKKQGFRLYFLSNFPDDIFDELVESHEFFNYFDGGLISARAKASKPGREIYEILLNKYSLKAEECLFADDLLPNVQGAEYVGIKGLHVASPDDLPRLLMQHIDITA